MKADLFEKCARFTKSLEAKQSGLYPYYRPLESCQSAEVFLRGRKMIMVGSNNYLGLADDPRVREAVIEAVRKYGAGSTGSRLLNGNLVIHDALEEQLAGFVGKPKALVFSTGLLANQGAISCLIGRNDVVLADRLDHASIIDGCRLGFGRWERFEHNDMASLAKHLAACNGSASGILVVVDAVFSMEGDISPLPEVVALCRENGARLMVDEAHAVGVFGDHGQGLCEHFHVTDQVDIIMGTFSKSLASMGGFIAGEDHVVEYIRHFSRAQIFTAGLSPADVAAAAKALEILRSEPERRVRLWENARRLTQEFKAMGYDTGNTQSPVIPLIIGDQDRAFHLWHLLHEDGIFVNVVLPPAVPPGRALIRLSCMATHTSEHLDRIVTAFRKAGKTLGII